MNQEKPMSTESKIMCAITGALTLLSAFAFCRAAFYVSPFAGWFSISAVALYASYVGAKVVRDMKREREEAKQATSIPVRKGITYPVSTEAKQ